MKRASLHILLGYSLLFLVSGNLVLSTLHSHHHIQWDHPTDFADTGTCITEDHTVCPICGYLLMAAEVRPEGIKFRYDRQDVIDIAQDILPKGRVDLPILGRAPPFPFPLDIA